MKRWSASLVPDVRALACVGGASINELHARKSPDVWYEASGQQWNGLSNVLVDCKSLT